MPFGLTNAPATFQRLMNEVLIGMIGNGVVVYLDDINIYSKNFEEYLKRVQEVFDRLHTAELKLKPSKCYFFKKKLSFLGHVIDAEGVSTDPAKIEKVKNYPVTKTVTQVRSFLGLASYYRKFMKNFSEIAKPLNELLK